jgi:hypothetical protein
MKVLVLYRPKSEHGRTIEEYIRDLRSHSRDLKLEVLNIDSRDGSAIASLYDIVRYPAILVLANDGYLQKSWEGLDDLPLMDEIVAYSYA